MSVININESVEHITKVVKESNLNNIGNISLKVCIYYTIYYFSITLLLYVCVCK